MDTLIATAFAALFAGCWVMEMRSSRKMREGHYDRVEQMKVDHHHDKQLAMIRSHDEGWLAGVEYQRQLMTRKRDKAGRFA